MDISAFLCQLGFPASYVGFPYLVYALSLVQSDQTYLYQIFKRLYPAVAGRFDTSPACVERDLRTLVRAFWARGGQQALERFAPCPERPTVGELIALLTIELKKQEGLLPL